MRISVVGTKQTSAAPERGTLMLQIGFEGEDRPTVTTQTRERVEAVLGLIRELEGRAPAPITWSSVAAPFVHSYTNYDGKGGRPVLWHRSSVDVQIRFRDFPALSDTAALAGEWDGMSVHGVEWSLTQATRDRLQAEVLAGAVVEAKVRASAIAKAAGCSKVTAKEFADPGLLGGADESQRMYGGGPHVARAASLQAGGYAGPGGYNLSPADIVVEAVLHARFDAR